MSETLEPGRLGRTMIVSPHDDDGLIGCGGLVRALQEPPAVVIVTDGALGYHWIEHKPALAARRQQEAREAYAAIGVPAELVTFLGYPDMSLRNYQNWTAPGGEPGGYQGLFRLMRAFRPETVFLPSEGDFHPDHKVTFDLGWVAAFQAKETLMPDLGAPAPVRRVFVYQVWEPLARASHAYALAPDEAERKRSALRRFASQAVILDELEAAGTLVYDREAFQLYRAF